MVHLPSSLPHPSPSTLTTQLQNPLPTSPYTNPNFEQLTNTPDRKCVMKDGVLTVNGKEYVFHKASGEYEW